MSKEILQPVEVTHNDLHSELVSHIVYDELSRQAQNHTGKKNRFSPLDWNPRYIEDDPLAGNPGQLLDDYRIEAVMTPGLEPFIEASAEVFLSGFSKITDSFYANTPLMESIQEKINAKENIVVVTNHGEIYDIAIILAALRLSLAKHAETKDETPIQADHYNLIVHRMISQLGVPDEKDPSAVSPALSILQLVGETYLSFPRTENAKKAHIPPELDRVCNENMLAVLHEKMETGSQILAFAPSGSKDESLLDKLGKKRKVIKPVNRGTYKLMQLPNTSVLGVGVALDHENGPVCSMTDLTLCTDDDACHELLDSIADKHAALTGIRTLYARKQTDLDAWRKEAHLPEILVPGVASDDPEKKKLLGALATGVSLGVAVGYVLGNYYRKKNK